MKHVIEITLVGLVMLTGCVEEGTPIGPQGGTVMSEDGRLMLEIPEGALEQRVAITVDEVACERPESVGPCYELGPVGLPLSYPGALTYEFDALFDGADVERLVLLTEREGQWTRLADREIDPHDGVVHGSVGYLSVYALAVRG